MPDPEKVTPEEAGAEPRPLPPDISTKPNDPNDEGATPEERGQSSSERGPVQPRRRSDS